MTTLDPKEQRSGIANENLQELIDCEDSAKWTAITGAQQYCTPDDLAAKCVNLLPILTPSSVLDPQAGKGALLNVGGWRTQRFAIEIDNRIVNPNADNICGNCVKAAEALDDLSPGLLFECVNANPPFAKRWKVGEKVIDSTEWTWQFVTTHGCFGFFISNYKTIERLGIHKHPYVYHYETHANVWPNCEVVIGVVHWHNKEAKASNPGELKHVWDQVRDVINEERGPLPPFNIYLDKQDKLKTYLSTRSKIKKKLSSAEIQKLARVSGQHPVTLTTERETRKLLSHLIECGFYTISPEASGAIKDALAQVAKNACPIMPVKDYELVAYSEEEDELECIHPNEHGFEVGKRYEFSTASYNTLRHIERNKIHYNEETKETYTLPHHCTLQGQDRYLQVCDSQGRYHRFLEQPDEDNPLHHTDEVLWEIFRKPTVETIADRFPAQVEANLRILRSCEMLAGFKYYPGQLHYLARVATKDYALIGAETGTGKSLMAITMIALKGPERALIIAPQGTMRSSEFEGDDEDETDYKASQWIVELRTFAPFLQVFELFSMDDYQRILDANGGNLPNGVYVTYYEAMFQNKARESRPASWDDKKLTDYIKKKFEITVPPNPDDVDEGWCKTIGMEKNGIRCIIEPCMATLIGHHFDMVLPDEAHKVCHLSSNLTQMLIRMQPRWRYALTATPIPNIVTDIFSVMGWLCVQDWYKKDRRNPAWPYGREDIGIFEETFLSLERDHTQEEINKAADPEWKGKCVKKSPVISSPARLLKILKPNLAHVSKESCNPNLVPCKVIDVRVGMGKEQSILYGHFLDRGNIPCGNPLVRARKQIAWLRGICADPAGFTHGGPEVKSNYNPKTIATLEVIRQVLEKGEQVVFVSARIGQTNTIHWKLREAKVSIARIDSTVPAEMHAYQANLFKAGKARVMLMGVKCAMGYSFPACPNLVVGSIEYAYGPLAQAKGRVWRVNSKYPVTVWCILHDHSIETVMFDTVATKEDAATICLLGQRMPRDFKPVDFDEILADSVTQFQYDNQPTEQELESQWPKLRDKIIAAQSPNMQQPIQKI